MTAICFEKKVTLGGMKGLISIFSINCFTNHNGAGSILMPH